MSRRYVRTERIPIEELKPPFSGIATSQSGGVRTERIPIEELKRDKITFRYHGHRVRTERIPIEELKPLVDVVGVRLYEVRTERIPIEELKLAGQEFTAGTLAESEPKEFRSRN